MAAAEAAATDAQLEAANAKVAALEAQLGAATGEVAATASQLEAAHSRGAALEAQLAATAGDGASQTAAQAARAAELEAALAAAQQEAEALRHLNGELQGLAEEVTQLREQQQQQQEEEQQRQQQQGKEATPPPPVAATPKRAAPTPRRTPAPGTPAPGLVELRWEISNLYERLQAARQAAQSAEMRLAAKSQVRPWHAPVVCCSRWLRTRVCSPQVGAPNSTPKKLIKPILLA